MIDNINDEVEEMKSRIQLGSLRTELQSIVRRISTRRIAEPTKRERDRIVAIKAEIKALNG